MIKRFNEENDILPFNSFNTQIWEYMRGNGTLDTQKREELANPLVMQVDQ